MRRLAGNMLSNVGLVMQGWGDRLNGWGLTWVGWANRVDPAALTAKRVKEDWERGARARRRRWLNLAVFITLVVYAALEGSWMLYVVIAAYVFIWGFLIRLGSGRWP